MENFKDTAITLLINLSNLPKDLKIEIMTYFNDFEITKILALVDKDFYQLSLSKELWQALLKCCFITLCKQFGITVAENNWQLLNKLVITSNKEDLTKNFYYWLNVLHNMHPKNFCQIENIREKKGKERLLLANEALTTASTAAKNFSTLHGVIACQLAIINFLLSEHDELQNNKENFINSAKNYCQQAIELNALSARYIFMFTPHNYLTKEEKDQIVEYIRELLTSIFNSSKSIHLDAAAKQLLSDETSIFTIISDHWKASLALNFNATFYCFKTLLLKNYNEITSNNPIKKTIEILNTIPYDQILYITNNPIQPYLLDKLDIIYIDNNINNFSLLQILADNRDRLTTNDIKAYINFYKNYQLEHPSNSAESYLLYYSTCNLVDKFTPTMFKKLATFLFKNSTWTFSFRFSKSVFNKFLINFIDKTSSNNSKDLEESINNFIKNHEGEAFANRFFCMLLLTDKIPILEVNWLPFIKLIWHYKDFYHYIIKSEFLRSLASDTEGEKYLYQLIEIPIKHEDYFYKLYKLFPVLARTSAQAKKLFDNNFINWRSLLTLAPKQCQFVLRFAVYITDITHGNLNNILCFPNSILNIFNQSDWVPTRLLKYAEMQHLMNKLQQMSLQKTHDNDDYTDLLDKIAAEIFTDDNTHIDLPAYEQHGFLGKRALPSTYHGNTNKRRKRNDGTAITVDDTDEIDEKDQEMQFTKNPQ